MSFVEWMFLLGGVAVVGPLVAHMLAKPRYRRLPFTMLRFLRIGQMESQSRRKLRDVLILLLRCAIVVLIAMLFARPILYTSCRPEKTRPVYFLALDNSMSMAYSDGSATYFGKMVDSAVDYIRSADDEGIFNICTLGSGDWARRDTTASQRADSLNKESALAEIQRLKIKPTTTNIGEFFSTLRTTRAREHSGPPCRPAPTRSHRGESPGEAGDTASVFVASDFTPNTLKQFIEIDEAAVVDNIDYEVLASPKPINNAAIIDASVNSISDGKLTINATVVNYGQVQQNRRLKAQIGTNKSTSLDVNLSANQRRTYQIQIDTGLGGQDSYSVPVELSLSAGDGLKEDDTFCLGVSLPQRKGVNVLLADEGRGEMFLLRTAMSTLSRMSSYEILNIKQVSIDDLSLSDLDWADVIVSSTITERLGKIAADAKNFAKSGGRIVFFITEEPSATCLAGALAAMRPRRSGPARRAAAKQLWDQQVLAALPRRCIRERIYIEPRPCDYKGLGMDNVAAKALTNYKIDKIVLTGYLECKEHPDSSCLWRLQNGFGFIYFKRVGSGTAVLVNTSVDDSLGSLTKSNASVAFCRYLLGQTNQIGEYCFGCDERVMLPAHNMTAASAERKQIWVETCDGRKRRAGLAEPFLLVPNAGGIGWVKTLTKPVSYAGVNLPGGETDMTKPVAEEVAKIMNRIFAPDGRQDTAAAEIFSEKKRRSIWTMFAWTIILLLLVEPAVANRLKR